MIDGIMQRAVTAWPHGEKRRVRNILRVGETAFRKRHDYVSIVSDTGQRNVLYVGKDRKTADLKQWFEALPRPARPLRACSMDMWPAQKRDHWRRAASAQFTAAQAAQK